MKKNIILIFLIFCVFDTKAQSWFPLNATWHYSITKVDTNSGFFFNSFMTLEVSADTTMLGHPCKMITQSTGNCSIFPQQVFMCEESGVVFFLNYNMTAFDTLIDMNKNIGEFWTVHPDNSVSTDSIIVTVTGKGTKVINNDTLQALKVNVASTDWQWNFSDSIIEKIGFYPGFFFFEFANCDPMVGGLRCYQDHSLGLFETGTASFCEEETGVGLSEVEISKHIFPNPTSDIIFIDNPHFNRCDIYNSTGQLVLQSAVAEISLAGLRNGVYFIRVFDKANNLCFSAKIVFDSIP